MHSIDATYWLRAVNLQTGFTMNLRSIMTTMDVVYSQGDDFIRSYFVGRVRSLTHERTNNLFTYTRTRTEKAQSTPPKRTHSSTHNSRMHTRCLKRRTTSQALNGKATEGKIASHCKQWTSHLNIPQSDT